MNATQNIANVESKVEQVIKVVDMNPKAGKPVADRNIVYVIECKDKKLDDKVYIGSTINTLQQRITEHKQCAKNPSKSTANDLYINMRLHGIEKYETKQIKQFATITKLELRQEEDKIKDEYIKKGVKVYNIRKAIDSNPQAQMNILAKWRKDHANRYNCNCCDYGCTCEIELDKHLSTKIHMKKYIASIGEEFATISNNYEDLVENARQCHAKYCKYLSIEKKKHLKHLKTTEYFQRLIDSYCFMGHDITNVSKLQIQQAKKPETTNEIKYITETEGYSPMFTTEQIKIINELDAM